MIPADDLAWTSRARQIDAFVLDVGWEIPSHVPAWLLPAGLSSSPALLPPGLPEVNGHVLSAAAAGAPGALFRFFAGLPGLPPLARRRETAAWSSLSVNLLVVCEGEPAAVVDMFGGSWVAAGQLLDSLADPGEPDGAVYDNLDQGWALRILIDGPAVLLRHWDWDRDPPGWEQAYRLPRVDAARQAAAARRRLDALQPRLIDAAGSDLWQRPRGTGEA